jgi:hypothetical protein
MDTDTYKRLRKQSGKLADEYMACVDRWIRSGCDRALADTCRGVAQEYTQALGAETDYLKSLPSTYTTRRQIARNEEFLEIVEEYLVEAFKS